ncbi:MAG: Uma2 family endonuclease [Caldilineaceae bacterium]
MAVLTVTHPSTEAQALAMVPTSPKQIEAATPVEDLLWRIPVDRYHQMINAGILTDDDPVELLEGLLVQKMPKNPPHHVVTFLVRRTLERLIADNWYIDSQEPITTEDSEPEPDVTVIRGTIFQYVEHHPGPEDTALIVEVADATLRRDRGRKKRIYARVGISVYWIVNLSDLQVEVYTEPDAQGAPPDYRQRRIYRGADRIPVVLDGTEVGQLLVSDILPPQLANKTEE